MSIIKNVTSTRIMRSEKAILATGCSLKDLLNKLNHFVLETMHGNEYFFSVNQVFEFKVNELATHGQKTRYKDPKFVNELKDVTNLPSESKELLDLKIGQTKKAKVNQNKENNNPENKDRKFRTCSGCNKYLQESRDNFYSTGYGFTKNCITCHKSISLINKRLNRELKKNPILTLGQITALRQQLHQAYYNRARLATTQINWAETFKEGSAIINQAFNMLRRSNTKVSKNSTNFKSDFTPLSQVAPIKLPCSTTKEEVEVYNDKSIKPNKPVIITLTEEEIDNLPTFML